MSARSSNHCRAIRAFTLIELMVVISVISLLVALLLPALTHAREAGRRGLCIANQRSIYQGAVNYTNDFSDYLPPAPHPSYQDIFWGDGSNNAVLSWSQPYIFWQDYLLQNSFTVPVVSPGNRRFAKNDGPQYCPSSTRAGCLDADNTSSRRGWWYTTDYNLTGFSQIEITSGQQNEVKRAIVTKSSNFWDYSKKLSGYPKGRVFSLDAGCTNPAAAASNLTRFKLLYTPHVVGGRYSGMNIMLVDGSGRWIDDLNTQEVNGYAGYNRYPVGYQAMMRGLWEWSNPTPVFRYGNLDFAFSYSTMTDATAWGVRAVNP